MNTMAHAGSAFVRKRTRNNDLLQEVILGLHTDDAIRQRKDYADLKDRLAYVYIHGSYPTHLRTWFTKLINMATNTTVEPAALDGAGGAVKVSERVAQQLNLEHHPMVMMVRRYVRDGWRIARSREEHTDRRPYSRVFLYRRVKAARGTAMQKLTVYVNGAEREGWH